MRRRLLLALLTILGVVAVLFATKRIAPRAGVTRVASSDSAVDSVALADSIERAASREAADTMCLAARIGLPCDPH